ncbi:ufm1-specific protease 2 [Copidosoma floridanum]|uniref:ufm1-specific protease 2 n=1 Tax=Copidosoma floridanum TaxID=29053 RepID=UPI0006C980FE|nr:ufm1-specific protease 2 [Copidosoma floridanum]
MAPRLKILSNVVEHLAKLNAAVTGHLYGVMYEETLTVLTFSINPVDDDDNKIIPIDLQLCMPAEVDLFGILYVDQYKQDIPDAFKDIDVTDNPLLIKYSLDAADILAFYYIHEKLEAMKYEIISEEDLWKSFCYIRLQASLPFISEKVSVLDNLTETRKKLATGKVSFHFLQSNIYLLGSDSNNDVEKKSVKDLFQASNLPDSKINKTKNPSCVTDAIEAGMFLKMSDDANHEEKIKFAPVVQHIKRPVEYYQFNLKIDTLSLVGYNITMAQLYEILVESICRNLRLIGSSFESQLGMEDLQLRLPEPMHFQPSDFGHMLTLVYPVGMSTLETYEYRKSLHRRLALDMNRPYFRKGNAVKFTSDYEKYEYLINPHEAVTNPGNHDISIVKGSYAYHHYMQDRFDDNGWGCAYRSLQTIVSWFRLQGYTDKTIPSHKEIQKCLVDIGDKSSNFVNSRQWIGSTEVGFVLESLFDIPVKILCASSGDEMPMLVSDLAHHFKTQGTPVMIGGGVLAHTILGVSHDEFHENVQFLILDPHYTGPEHLATIVSKGWCGWKKKEFWKKDAFYNMCLPQKPKCI